MRTATLAIAALLALGLPAAATQTPTGPSQGRSADAALDRLLSRDAGEEPDETRDPEPVLEDCALRGADAAA
jgi:hypothetical protein